MTFAEGVEGWSLWTGILSAIACLQKLHMPHARSTLQD